MCCMSKYNSLYLLNTLQKSVRSTCTLWVRNMKEALSVIVPVWTHGYKWYALTQELFGDLWHFFAHFAEDNIPNNQESPVNTSRSLKLLGNKERESEKCQVVPPPPPPPVCFSRLHAPLLSRCPDNVSAFICVHLFLIQTRFRGCVMKKECGKNSC